MSPSTTHKLLADIVDRIEYRPGWRVGLAERDGVLTLEIVAQGYDTYHPEDGPNRRIIHPFIVPPATYNEESWTRWVFDCYIAVETHEAAEFFKLVLKGDFVNRAGERTDEFVRRPFAPNHGPGWNPYVVRELNTVEAAETTNRGERREGTQG